MKKKPIAIFDIDGTIFRSSLAIEIYRELVAMNIFTKKSWQAIQKKQKPWLDREGGYDKYVSEMIRWIEKEIKGKKQSDVVRASRKMLKIQQKRTYRYTRHLVKLAQKKYFSIGISGSPLEVVREYNKLLKFDKVYGTEFGVDESGRYTGKVLHVPPQYKKEIITRYVKSHNLSLKGSFGVGDTQDDAGFLELVEDPIAFNPNYQLAQIAKKKGWKVVVERKDMVYEINPKKVKYISL